MRVRTTVSWLAWSLAALSVAMLLVALAYVFVVSGVPTFQALVSDRGYAAKCGTSEKPD